MNPECFKSIAINDTAGLLAHTEHLPPKKSSEGWLFRGSGKPYELQTSLERLILNSGIPLSEAADIERKLLKEFKRRAHHYVAPLPNEGDVMGWFALMQHHGAPTRLLDWTYSFYVATFFALAEASSFPTQEPAVVWALYRNDFTLENQAPDAGTAYDVAAGRSSQFNDIGRPDTDNIQDGINSFVLHMMEFPKRSVWAVNSFRLNERLSLQQGVFLCPGDVTTSFESNLAAGRPSPENFVRFEFSTEPDTRSNMLMALHRMNINYASLFPGLDGFSRSLWQAPWVKGKLRPDKPEHR